MECNNIKKIEIFPMTLRNYVSTLIIIKGILDGKDIIIFIAPNQCNNYINTRLANELLIIETKITEKAHYLSEKQYTISDLQLKIRDYYFIS